MSPSSPGGHLGLLRRVASFRLLLLSTLGSGLGTMLAVIALTVDVYDRTGSGLWVSALLIADFLPAIAIGLLLGPLLDRLSRRRMMIAADLARALVFCALPFAGGTVAIVALAGVAGFATGFFRPAVYAGLPNLVEEDELPQANALLQAIDRTTWAFGPLLGGILVAVSGPSLAYWINAATFLVSAVLIARIPGRLLQSTAALSKGHWQDLADGFRLVRGSRALLTVLIAWTIAMLGNGAVTVAEVVLAKVSFHAGDFGFGLLFASAGLGLVLGSFATGSLIQNYQMGSFYGLALALMAFGVGAAAAAPSVWVAAASLVLFGFGNGGAGVCNSLLVQRGAPDALRGRAFTLIMSANYAVLGGGMALAGGLTDVFGARWVWAGASVSYVLAACAGFALGRGIRPQEDTRRADAAELATTPAAARATPKAPAA